MSKCCGTCYWWSKLKEMKHQGDCTWMYHNKTPMAMREMLTCYMFDTEGINCPCWKEKKCKTSST